MNHGGGRAIGDEPGTLGKRVRENGFYWVRLPIRGNVEVCLYHSDGEMTAMWYIAGWDGWYDDAEVTVLSERLVPPEVKQCPKD